VKWIEVSVRVASSQMEPAADQILGLAPQGLWESSDGGGRRRVLRAYVPATPWSRAAIRGLRRLLAPVAPSASVRTRVVRDTTWVNAWKATARRIRIGRLLIQPSWMKDEAPGRAVIRLDAGMAFGSGEHPSTRLCLRAIERHMRAGGTVIDVGTGSGILAIAAARLGAARVLAIDNDPVAVDVASANVRANGVAHRVSVRRGQGLARVRTRADLIAANLTADTLPPLLADVRRSLVPGGRFIAAGFGTARVRDVRRQLTKAALRVAATEQLHGWCAVHAIRPIGGSR